MRVVVVGHGMAGGRVADELRRRGAAVTVFAAEPHHRYNRILLSSLLAGRTRESDITLPESAGVELRQGVEVTAIDPARRTVTASDGSITDYDALVLATGSRPWFPPVAGLWRGEHLVAGAVGFRTLDDCRRILTRAGDARHAVVLGGGLLGLEAAHGLARRGLAVQVVHAAGHLMERQLDPGAADVLARALRGMGIGLRTGVLATEVAGDRRVRAVRLADGTELAADLLVVACGVRPETTLAGDAGLTVKTGVVVDDALRTSDPAIYAVGDCAEHAGVVYGLVAPAWEQSRVAAEVITGGDARYPGSRLVTRLKTAGVDLAVLGDSAHLSEPDVEAVTFSDPARGTYQKVVVRDGRVHAAILLGDNPTVGSVVQLYDRAAPVPADRRALLLAGAGVATPDPADESPALIPDRAVVCRCNAVTKGAITRAWLDGARDVDAVVDVTRAGTGCGGCRDAVAGICGWLAASDAAPVAAGPAGPVDQTTESQQPETAGSSRGGVNAVAGRVVVVGNGMVSQRFVEALTDRDPGRRWQITVLGEESRPAYDRVALSSFFDGMSPEDLVLAGERWYAERGATLRLGVRVTGIDRERRLVTSTAGEHRYDVLVLATGSYPFVPPVPGHDLPGCFSYRTLDDLEQIREYAAGRRVGAVVGGGLLGLEAANALRLLDLDTHVVEFAPRLMPLQVDDAGGQVLTRHIRDLGLHVHVGTRTERIEPGRLGGAARMILDDAGPGQIDVDVVVFAAGVRPRDELARAAGLAVGERGGVLVDGSCRTSDPEVYAIGEVAAVDGRCYGLVAPGYAMAEVVADRLVGGDATFPGADTSTKLKLLGVDVASFGDAFGQTEGALDVVYTDPVAGRYAKLVVSDDAGTLLGGILVGDASAYPALRASLGQSLAGSPLELLGAGASGGGGAALPGDAQVCSCHAVTKDEISTAISEQGCADVATLKTCTKAGTGCGSCVPLLKSLLAESGVAMSKALCEHFSQSRQELFDIIRVRGIRTFSELIREHGTGRGCDICKPAVASILASQGNGHILDGEQATLQDTNDHVLANLQRNGTYSVVPRIPGGEVTPEKLIVIGEVARDFNLYTKITGAQRIDLLGARVEQLPAIWRRLVDAGFESGHAYGKALRTVKSCVGSTWCRYGVQDSVGMAIALELRYRGLRAPHKIKCAVSGCARECAEARSKDVGVIATENGWNLYLGGNGGFQPRHADLFATDLSDVDLIRYIDRFLMFYIRTADRLQRTAAWLESLEGGLDHLREVIVDDSLGLCGELDAAMDRHVADYADEWAGVLDDPDKLRRFASFVNAPDTPDPSIEFVSERGQPVPAPTFIAGPSLPTRATAAQPDEGSSGHSLEVAT
jgi:nitrite reductase (NADH) large subunit